MKKESKLKMKRAAVRRLKYKLFADYFQFYLQDESVEFDPSRACKEVDLLLAWPRAIAVLTVRNMTVPVTVELHDAEPKSDVRSWDHAVECSLEICSGKIVIFGCTDYVPDAARIKVPNGLFRVRVSYGALDTLSENGLKGSDTYRVQLWPAKGKAIKPRVIKQRMKTK